MTKNTAFALTPIRSLVMVALACAACSRADHAGPQAVSTPTTKTIEVPTQVIQIPVRLLTEANREQPPGQALTIRPAQPEQPAEGPSSFDVLADGTIVIADPLAERLVMFGSDGTFKKALGLETPVDDVRVLALGICGSPKQFRIPAASLISTGVACRARTSTRGKRSSHARRCGLIEPVFCDGPSSSGDRSAAPSEIAVDLAEPNQRLASLRPIDVERKSVYVSVASAATSGGSPYSVSVTVRRYSPTGVLDREVKGISTNADVPPRTPFRVSDGRLYQLSPNIEMVRIYVWDLR